MRLLRVVNTRAGRELGSRVRLADDLKKLMTRTGFIESLIERLRKP